MSKKNKDHSPPAGRPENERDDDMSEGNRDERYTPPPADGTEIHGLVPRRPQKPKKPDPPAPPAPKPVREIMSVDEIVEEVALIKEVMKRILRPNVHYGIVPGAKKPTLWQPGADILNRLFKLAPTFEVISSVRNGKMISYTVRCAVRHRITGEIWAEGFGSCSTLESKYTRNLQTASERAQRYGKPPITVWELDNTILKMACKRSKAKACLNATAASELFTLDIEDMAPEMFQNPQRPPQASPHPGTKPQQNGGRDYGEIFG